jgi:protein O-mannosyl-transferase
VKRLLEPRWAVASCIALAIAAYVGSLGHGFAYDDVALIALNNRVHSLANWSAILHTPWWGDAVYRPFTALTIAADWMVSGGDPRWFHVVNVLLHAGVTVLVYVLARAIVPPFAAFMAGALFAVHPAHVEAVANVVGRAEVLAALFALAAVLLYRADGALAERGDVTWRRWLTSWGVLGSLLLALASKETAFVTPGLLWLIDWLDGQRSGRSWGIALRRHWVLWVATVVLTGEWLVVWTSVAGSLAAGIDAPGLEGAGLGRRAVVMAPVALEYVRLLAFPARLSADYSPDFLPIADQLTVRGAVGWAVVAGVLAAGLAARRRAPALAFAVAWVAGTLFVVSNLIVPTEILLAERTLYLPSVGAVVLLGYGLDRLAGRWRVAAGAVAAILLGLGVLRTVTRVPVWRNNETLLPQLVRDAPGSFKSYWVAAAVTYTAGDSVRGEALLRRALAVYPLARGVWADLATQLEHRGRWHEAATANAAAFRLDSTRVGHAAQAIVDFVRAGGAGGLDSAETLGRAARRVAPLDYRLLIALGDLALARGRPLEAMTLRRQVAWRFPDVWWYWYLTAQAALDAAYCPEAERSFLQLRRLGADTARVAEVARKARSLCKMRYDRGASGG